MAKKLGFAIDLFLDELQAFTTVNRMISKTS